MARKVLLENFGIYDRAQNGLNDLVNAQQIRNLKRILSRKRVNARYVTGYTSIMISNVEVGTISVQCNKERSREFEEFLTEHFEMKIDEKYVVLSIYGIKIAKFEIVLNNENRKFYVIITN